MPLPASGSISLSQVNVELGLSATAQISLNDSAVRTLFGRASGANSMSDGRGKANQFAFTISSNQTNANLATLATAAGWNGSSKLIATIGSGVYLSSSSTGTPALTVSGSFPGGVELINQGFIVGMGGAGGNGGGSSADSTVGGGGGLALSVSSAISINNTGTIAGGGGGGGGGGAGRYNFFGTVGPGGGGGGGRSSQTSSAGGGANGGSVGNAGTVSAAGSGGVGGTGIEYYSKGYGTITGGTGGSGGGWGSAGSTGGSYSAARVGGGVQSNSTLRTPKAGGGAGGAVTGNSNITWIATGTRIGGIS